MKLTPQHLRAIEHLAVGETNKSVAEKLDIAPETVSRWRSDFDFQAVLNKMLHESKKSAGERLRTLTDTALATIEVVLNDSEAPHKDRLAAAFKILELTKIAPGQIGSPNPETLRTQKERDDLLDSFIF